MSQACRRLIECLSLATWQEIFVKKFHHYIPLLHFNIHTKKQHRPIWSWRPQQCGYLWMLWLEFLGHVGERCFAIADVRGWRRPIYSKVNEKAITTKYINLMAPLSFVLNIYTYLPICLQVNVYRTHGLIIYKYYRPWSYLNTEAKISHFFLP